jgi:RHS repeat-associated protein
MGALKLTYQFEEYTQNLRVAYKSHSLNLREPSTKDGQKLRLHYCVFGMPMPNRTYSASQYRFGFNGHEIDPEIKGVGNHVSFGDYGYDPRLSRRWNIDPEYKKFPSFSSYACLANNPILMLDPTGRIIDLSNMSDDEKAEYCAKIEKMTDSKLFNYYYNVLQKSETVYKVQMGSPEGGGSFDPATNTVGLINTGAYTISQELFHAYQADLKVYDNKIDRSSMEAEGDLVASKVATEVGESSLGLPWAFDILYNPEYIDNNLLFTTEGVSSEEFANDFTNAVDKRIEYYKQREKEDANAYAPKGYISPNSGVEPKALIKAVLESQSDNNVGPRLENGDFYDNP